MKKLILILLLPLLLTGCLGIGEDTNKNEQIPGEIEYSNDDFSIYIPQDWEIIEKSDFTSSVPQETIVVFRNNIKSDIFTATVNISMVETDDGMTSSDLAISSKTLAQSSLVSFKEKSMTDMEIPFGNDVIQGSYMTFTGKKSALDPIIHFDQIYVVNKNKGYIVTASCIEKEDETVVNYLDRMLKSFALK